MYSFWSEHNTMNSSWDRSLRSWESDQAKEIEKILKELQLLSAEDKVLWKYNVGVFSIKSCLEVLESSDPQFVGI